MWRGTCKICCALVNLVEGIGADHYGIRFGAIDDSLCKGEQGLAAAVDRQHLGLEVGQGDSIAPHQPFGDRAAQRVCACGCGIIRQATKVIDECGADKLRRVVFRLTDRQADCAVVRIGFDIAEQAGQFLERVGLQTVEIWIHCNRIS